MSVQSLVALGAAEDVLRELRYCRWNHWAFRHPGRIGQAQTRAERIGWLMTGPCDLDKTVKLTDAGRLAIEALAEAIEAAKPAAAKAKPKSALAR